MDEPLGADGTGGDVGAPAPSGVEEPTSLEPAAQGETERSSSSLFRWFGELVLLVGLAFVLALAIRSYVVQPFYIPTSSMVPTLQIGDRVLVSKFAYRFGDPAPGDIVVLNAPSGEDTDLIKRIIAIEGQTIDIQEGIVTVDGERLDEPYVNPRARDDSSLTEPLVVPDGHVFLMGDNRPNSSDSRVFGTQPEELLQGKAFLVYWPFANAGGL